MVDVMLSTAAEMVPRSKRPRGAHSWRLGSGVGAEMNAAWHQREEARRYLPHSSSLGKAVKMAGKNLRKGRKAAVLSFFWDFVRKPETRAREGDQARFYKHLRTMNLEGKRYRSSAYVIDENGVMESLWSGRGLLRKRWCCARGWWMMAGAHRIIAGDAWNLVVLSSLSTPFHGHTLVTYHHIYNTSIQPTQLIQLNQ